MPGRVKFSLFPLAFLRSIPNRDLLSQEARLPRPRPIYGNFLQREYFAHRIKKWSPELRREKSKAENGKIPGDKNSEQEQKKKKFCNMK